MAIVGKAPTITLHKFFIYNPTLGPCEGEEEKKILYYYPPDMNIDMQIRDVGFCEGLIKFASTFKSNDKLSSLHTQRTRQLILEAENDYFIVMCVLIPFTEKVKDDHKILEFQDEDVQDIVYQSVLRLAYEMFRLFLGTFTGLVKGGEMDNLKQRLEHFYSRYLPKLSLVHADILEVFGGIHFLPLDKNMFLRIQSFINTLESKFSAIQYTAFLYNEKLVWSGLEQDDMRVMYNYLISNLLPSHLANELQSAQDNVVPTKTTTTTSSHYGKYIVGPMCLNDSSLPVKVPDIYIKTDSGHLEKHNLLVYRALSTVICLIVNADRSLPFEFYRNVDSFLGPHLSKISSEIAERHAQTNSIASPNAQEFKYIYFNKINLAQKSTIHSETNRRLTCITPNAMRLLGDIHVDMNTDPGDDTETIMKTESDCWIVGKKSDHREFFVVVNQKNANLIEIAEDVKRVCQQHFANIFFLD